MRTDAYTDTSWIQKKAGWRREWGPWSRRQCWPVFSVVSSSVEADEDAVDGVWEER